MQSYLNLLNHVMTCGKDRIDRTGVGTRAVFAYQWRHNLADGFPLLTTKKVFFKGVVVELLWFLRGDTNIKFLHDHDVHIWDEWADANGDLGPVYGKQWRQWEHNIPGADGQHKCEIIDQVSGLLNDLKKNPFSRRHIVSAWNPADVPKMKLPPCHTLWQCQVEEVFKEDCDACYGTGTKMIPQAERCHCQEISKLNLHLYARSIDSFLGLPFNIASYALLNHILAHLAGLTPGDLIISFGDLHIYNNHFAQVNEQLSRAPRALPRLVMNAKPTIELFVLEDFTLEGYDPLPGIKAPIAV